MGKSKQDDAAMFTKSDYQTLVDARRRLNNLIATCDKAEACGVNVAVWRQQRDDLDNQLAAIQQHFMTPPPA